MRPARKISDLPSAWIKKIKGIKGAELLGQPCCRGGLEHLQQNCGKGSGEGRGLEASTALMGKRRLEAMTKLCLGLGNWSCLSWVKKQQAQSSEHSGDGPTLPIMCRPYTCDSKLYAVVVKKITTQHPPPLPPKKKETNKKTLNILMKRRQLVHSTFKRYHQGSPTSCWCCK